MPDQTRNGMQCAEFDSLLTDALDGVLSGAGLDRFQVHAKSCKACGPLLAEAEAGRNWLRGLTEVEPPASLVTNILASTTGVDTQRLRTTASVRQPRISWWEQVQASFFEPVWAMVRQPRFAMSFGMAFFALSVGLTVAGVKPGDLREISLKPSAIRLTYYRTHARVVHYYDNVKVVYQLQSMLNEFKRTPPAEPGPATKKEHKNDTTQQPEQKQERNYTQTRTQLILASASAGPCLQCCDLPVVSVTTDRRFV
jgi:Putative zinc-finger